MKTQSQRGLTLIEMSTALGIAAVTATSAIGGFGSLLDKRHTEGVAAELASDLQYVRTEAVARNRGVRISFAGNPSGVSCYVIHTGPAGACSCLSAGPASCTAEATEIKTVRLAAGARTRVQSNVGSMLYDPTRGTVTPTATLQVRSTDGSQLNHVVNLLGRVRTCAAAGSWPGYKSC